jgi:hypothetical protein
MSEIVIFSIGAVLFILLTWATMMFLYLRFNDIYRIDQAATDGPDILMDGNVELLTKPDPSR